MIDLGLVDKIKIYDKIKTYEKNPEAKLDVCTCSHFEFAHQFTTPNAKCLVCQCKKFEFLAELTVNELQELKEEYTKKMNTQ